jgi:predicted nucleic acid-binding protein
VSRLYVESNFIVELVRAQEQVDECERLLVLGEEQEGVELVLPAFCLAEPLHTVRRGQAERRSLQDRMQRELKQIRRSRGLRGAADSYAVSALFVDAAEQENARLESFYRRIAEVVDLVALTSDVVDSAFELGRRFDLMVPDAMVLASVLHHADVSPGPFRFVTKDKKDFDDPELRRLLQERDGDLLTSFGSAVGYVLNPA